MSQFTIIGTPLYQWESGRKMRITPLRGMTVDSVHFSNYGDSTALVVKPKEENGHYIADIPNILLQDDQNIVVYSVNVSEDKVETIRECVFPVRKRAKPSTYVYTETEVLSYSYLDKRIDHLEGEGLSNTVSEYMEKHPVKDGVDGKDGKDGVDGTSPVVSVSSVTGGHRITVTDINGTKTVDVMDGVDGQPGKDGRDGKDGYTPVNGVDYFDGKDGQDGRDGVDGKDGSPGADGYTPVKGVDYFTPAEIQKVAEQAAEMVDVPKKVSQLENDAGYVTEDDLPEILQENKWELIERITLGYELLTEKPADWETNYANYYWWGDSEIAQCSKDWQAGKMYKSVDYEPITEVARTIEPNGKPYNFKKIFIKVVMPKADGYTANASINYAFNKNAVLTMTHITDSKKWAAVRAVVDSGAIMLDGQSVATKWASSTVFWPSVYRNLLVFTDSINELRIYMVNTALRFAKDTVFEIWGVRA